MSFFSNLLTNSGILENSKIVEDFERLLLQDEAKLKLALNSRKDTFIFTNIACFW